MKFNYSYSNFLKSNIPITYMNIKKKENQTKFRNSSQQKNKNLSSLKLTFSNTNNSTYNNISTSNSILKSHINCDLCHKCHNYHKLLHTDKKLLSEYIQTNNNYLKLIGNSRYKNISPLKFVQDHKNEIINRNKIGLIPVPSKSGSKIQQKEKKPLYELQRSIVMIRRFQYNKKNFVDEEEYENYFLSIVIKIQLWWKKLFKIIKIQKNFKGWYIRKAYKSLVAFKILMDKFENVLNVILIKKCFRKIKNYFTRKINFFNNNNKLYNTSSNTFFITKKYFFISSKIFKSVVLIQKFLRKFFSMKKRKKLTEKIHKNVKKNKIWITKIFYNKKNIFDKIIFLQMFYKMYFNNKNNNNKIFDEFDNKYFHNNNNKFMKNLKKYYEKNFNVVKLNKNEKDKNVCYFDKKRIKKFDNNKICFIQNYIKQFLDKKNKEKNVFKLKNKNNLNNKYNNKNNNNYSNNNNNDYCYISKNRINKITYKNFIEENKFEKNIIKNINFGIKNNNFNNINNNCSFISKTYKINFINFLNQIKLIQKKIKKFLFDKKYNSNIKNKKITFLSQPIKSFNYISKKNLINNIHQIKLLQKKFKQNKQKEKFIKSQTIKKCFNNNNNNFITKINLIKIKQIKKTNFNLSNFFTKKIYLKKKQNPKLYFINLLSLHITKNTQQLIFYKLKYNIFINFSYPFYIKTILNVLKFLLNYKEKDSNSIIAGKKIYNLFKKIFPNFQEKNSLKIISTLNQNQQKQLISSNIYSSIEPDFINFLTSYSKYYKNISNENFIKERLKYTNLINTNIFTLIKFIDNEYENYVNEKYCYKCFITKDSCQCSKKSTENDEMNSDFDTNKEEVIQQFEKVNYIETSVKNKILNRKPRLEECYQDPITNMIDSGKNANNYNSINFNTNDNNYNTNDNFYFEDDFNMMNEKNNNFKKNVFDDEEDEKTINKRKNIENIKNILHKEKNYNKNNQVFIKKED